VAYIFSKPKITPDYKKIINVFDSIQKPLCEKPRADMVPFETDR
jgi:hypothetical protein